MNSGSADSGEDLNIEEKISADQIDGNFLPLIHDIIKTVERDERDNAAKNLASIEAGQKIQELSKKFDSVRETVKKLPGIDFTKEEQQANLRALKKQLVLKRQLIEKYKEAGNSLTIFNNTDQLASTAATTAAVNGMDTN